MMEMGRWGGQARVWLEFDYEKKEKKKEAFAVVQLAWKKTRSWHEQRDKKKDGTKGWDRFTSSWLLAYFP